MRGVLANPGSAAARPLGPGCRLCRFAVLVLLLATALPLQARKKDGVDYGTGLIVNIPLPQDEVTLVVSEVAKNGIIRGTKEYNKDEYIAGASAPGTTPLFPAWTDGGKVFYKVRLEALDPRNFKDSNDVGTLAVRYVVQPQGEKNTVLRIDALFVEDFRHIAHPSNGSVESSEYKDIQDHLDAIELIKKQTAEAEEERQERLAKKKFSMSSNDAPAALTPPPVSTLLDESRPDVPVSVAMAPGETLEQHVANLRRQVERRVRIPGAALKSAPFHSASTLKALPTGTEVLIVISTTYWFGVETHDGQHGWIPRDQLEQMP